MAKNFLVIADVRCQRASAVSKKLFGHGWLLSVWLLRYCTVSMRSALASKQVYGIRP